MNNRKYLKCNTIVNGFVIFVKCQTLITIATNLQSALNRNIMHIAHLQIYVNVNQAKLCMPLPRIRNTAKNLILKTSPDL